MSLLFRSSLDRPLLGWRVLVIGAEKITGRSMVLVLKGEWDGRVVDLTMWCMWGFFVLMVGNLVRAFVDC